MKILKLFSIFFIVSLCLSCPSGRAVEGGAGTRGGGFVVDIDSTPYLMDLVSRAVCEWTQGEELLDTLPQLRVVLNKINELDPPISKTIEAEIRSLGFCFTGPLLLQASAQEEAQSFAYSVGLINILPEEVSQRQVTRQAGYRLDDKVYLDEKIFQSMNEANKAMLIIHETLHSFISMEVTDRAMKLRSMVKTLDKVRTGLITKRDKVIFAVKMNEFDFSKTIVGNGSIIPNSTSLVNLDIKTVNLIVGEVKKSQFSLPDAGHLFETESFFKKVQAAGVEYLRVMEKDVIPELVLMRESYDAVYNSVDLSPHSKDIVLKQLINRGQKKTLELSKIYQQALRDFYALVPHYDLAVAFNFFPQTEHYSSNPVRRNVEVLMETNLGHQFKSEITYNGVFGSPLEFSTPSEHLKMHSSQMKFNIPFDHVFEFKNIPLAFPEFYLVLSEQIFFPDFKGTCLGALCMSFRAAERSNLLTLIREFLDRDLVVMLAGGESFKISALNQDIQAASKSLAALDYLK